MLYRAIGEYQNYISRFGLATSTDGFNFKRVNKKPMFAPERAYDRWGTEDPRITEIDDTIYIAYAAISQPIMKYGKLSGRLAKRPPLISLPAEAFTAAVGLLSTKDFKSFKRHGVISPRNSDNKDVVLFPEKIGGKYVMLHRPHRWCKRWFENPFADTISLDLPCPTSKLPELPSIWIAYSYDLKKWFGHKVLIESSHEMDEKIGAGSPPIKIKDGWLLIYHHVEKNAKRGQKGKLIYTAKMALLNLKNPAKVIAKVPHNILAPEKPYERKGNVDNVVFPTGRFIKDGRLFVYYGAADKYCALATGDMRDITRELRKYKV